MASRRSPPPEDSPNTTLDNTPFFEDLARTHERTGPWQIVLFTGDLVQQGRKDEYEKLEEKVLSPLWERMKQLGSEPPLVAVPGNHDLQRPETKKVPAALRQLLKTDDFPAISEDFFSDPVGEYREVINKAFASYAEWWKQTPYRHPQARDGLLPGEFSVTLEIDDVRIGVVGLNTTFLQLAGGNYLGRLEWDVQQFNAACLGDPSGDGPGWVRDHDLCLLMTHQGPEWLSNHSREDVYREINPAGRFAVHLFGHMHENVVCADVVGRGQDSQAVAGKVALRSREVRRPAPIGPQAWLLCRDHRVHWNACEPQTLAPQCCQRPQRLEVRAGRRELRSRRG